MPEVSPTFGRENDLFRPWERQQGMTSSTTTNPGIDHAAATIELVERFIDRCLDPVDAVAAPEFTSDPKALAIHAGFAHAFPDGRFRPTWRVVEGRRAVVGGLTTGTHLGDFRGIAPTERRIDVMTYVMFECVDGQIVDLSVMPDTLAIAEQLGLLAPLGPKACELVGRDGR
jgi:hypothetical protein